MKKILKIILILILLTGLLYWKNNETKKTTNQDIFFEELPKEIPETESIFNYSTEKTNDKINFKIGDLNFYFNRFEDYKTSLTVSLSNKVIFSDSFDSYVSDIIKLKWKEKEIILVNYFSGGAHCCTTVIPYLVDNDKIIEGQSMFQGNTSSLNTGSFFIKDGKLFTFKSDDRFSYFEMDYATSSNTMRLPYFAELKIDPLEFIESNKEFVYIYKKLYKNSQINTKKILTKEYCNQTEEYKKFEAFGNLVNRYSLGYFSQINREKLKNELKKDWWCFPEKDFNKIENEIYFKLSEGDTSLISNASKIKITELINSFEEKIKNRDRTIINMFSDPENTDDKKSLAFLKADLGGQMRIFSIALFSYDLLDYKIGNMKVNGNQAEISIIETRKNYDNSSGKYFDSTEKFIINIRINNGNYYVEKYYREGTKENKYNGLYLI